MLPGLKIPVIFVPSVHKSTTLHNYYSSDAARFKNWYSKIDKAHVLSLLVVGAAIIPVCSLFQQVPPSPAGEYHYSRFLSNNFTFLAKTVYVLAGFAAGYYCSSIHPLLIGLLLFFIFPFVIMVEGTVYRGSHNLLPLELIVVFIFSLPSVIAALLGRLLHKQRLKKKARLPAA